MTLRYNGIFIVLLANYITAASLETSWEYPDTLAEPPVENGDSQREILHAGYDGVFPGDSKGLPMQDFLSPNNIISQEVTKQKITHSNKPPFYPHEYKLLIDVPNLCKDSVFLLVIVCSSVENLQQRNAIRKTWASNLEDDVRIVFMTGSLPAAYPKREFILKSLLNESNEHHDIIQEDFTDSYKNLSIKSVGLLKWTTFNCKAKYILKTDDDVFINVPLLLTDLRNTIHKRFIMGNIIAGAQPIQDKTSKYYTPTSVYAKSSYPKYMSGSAYVISGDLIGELYKASLHTAPFWLEDIYVTGLLAEKVEMVHIFNGKFGYKKRTLHPCLFKHVITGHYVSPPEMLKLWWKIQNGNYSCERTRLSAGNMDGTD